MYIYLKQKCTSEIGSAYSIVYNLFYTLTLEEDGR